MKWSEVKWHNWGRDKESRSWCGVLQSQTAEAHGHMGRLERASLNRTENFVRFQGPPAERSDGFSRKCAILFCTSHPAAARFRRSFRIPVCKTSLMSLAFTVGHYIQSCKSAGSGKREVAVRRWQKPKTANTKPEQPKRYRCGTLFCGGKQRSTKPKRRCRLPPTTAVRVTKST